MGLVCISIHELYGRAVQKLFGRVKIVGNNCLLPHSRYNHVLYKMCNGHTYIPKILIMSYITLQVITEWKMLSAFYLSDHERATEFTDYYNPFPCFIVSKLPQGFFLY